MVCLGCALPTCLRPIRTKILPVKRPRRRGNPAVFTFWSPAMAKRGPKTDFGRAAVRHNAVQHGIRSPTPVVAGLERDEGWLAHRAGMLASLSPEGQLEEALAERVILTLWRL